MAVTLKQDVAGVIPIDGVPTAVSLAAGQMAHYSFNATAGQWLGLGISGLSFGPGSAGLAVAISKPDGTQFSTSSPLNCTGTWIAPGDRCALRNLPVSGTYTLLIGPAGYGTANMAVTIKQDSTGTLPIDGGATALALGVGQNAHYTFTGVAGQSLGLGISALSFGAPSADLSVNVYKPDGTVLASSFPGQCPFNTWFAPGDRCTYRNLPVSGVYTVYITPTGSGTANMNITVKQDATGNLVVNGTAAPIALTVGQNGRYTFTGTAGQWVGLGLSGLSFASGTSGLYFALLAPDGSTLSTPQSASCNTTWVPPGAGCHYGNLPASGTYTILFSPSGAGTVNMTATLSTDITGAITVNGKGAAKTVTFSTTRAGQYGRYTFSVTAGKSYTLVWSASTLQFGRIYAQTPTFGQFGIAADINNTTAASGTRTLGVAATTGTYTMYVDPVAGSVGNVTMQVTSP